MASLLLSHAAKKRRSFRFEQFASRSNDPILGTQNGSSTAVVSDANAVTSLRSPVSQYKGLQSTTTSMACINPHATMKNPKATKIVPNGMFRFSRYSSQARVHEIARQERQRSESATAFMVSSRLFYK